MKVEIKRVAYQESGENGALGSDVWGTLIDTFIFILLQAKSVHQR